MKKFIIFTAFLLISICSFAQDVLFEEEVKDYSQLDETGPNLKKYTHAYFSFGFVLGEEYTGAPVQFGSSTFFRYGVRHKRKFCNMFSVGYDITATGSYFYMKQDSSKIILTKDLHDKEGFYFYSLGAGLFMRFNFNNKRGNIMGIYMDLGANADWNYSFAHVVKDTKNGIKSKTKSRGYDFVSPFSYGPVVRFGYNQFALSAAYRYSNIFEKSANFPELPRFLLGFELSFI